MKILIFILLALAITVKTDYSSPVKGIQEFKELYKIIAGTLDHTATIVFDHPDCYRCGQSESTIQEYAEENEGFTQVFVVDCESMWQDADGQKSMPMCSPDHTAQLPVVLLIEPSTSTGQQPQQHPYQGALSQRDLSKFLRKHMPAYRETIKSKEDYQEFIEFPQFEHKMILLTNKEKTSPLYKAVASTYRDRILFGEVHESVSDVVSEFKFDKYPALFLLKKQSDGTHKPEKFVDELNYKNIADYLEDFALEKKVNRAYAKKKSSKNTENKQEKKEKEQQIEVRKVQLDKIEKQIYTIEKPVLVNVKKQGESHSQFEEIKKKYQLLFDYFEYDVQDADQEEQVKEILKVKSIPSIRFYPPGLVKKPHSSIQFRAKETDMKEIHAEIQYQIPDHTHSATDEQSMQMSFQSLLQQQKVVLLYFYEKEVSLSLRVAALQEQYSKKFGFVTYKNPTEAIRQQFQIQKLPHMVALFREADTQKKSALEQEEGPQEGEQVQVAGYSGKFNYKDISNFLNMWINMKEGGAGTQQEKEIQELKNMNDFKKYCQGSSQCYIAILNGAPEQREDEFSKLSENIKLLKRLAKRYSGKSINFVWIDGICHSEILYPLDMSDDQIPNFITYSHAKQSIAKMIGRFDIESLSKFVERANSFKVNYQALNMNDFNIKDLDCIEQHQKIAERQKESQTQTNDEDDDILKELLAEQAEKDKAQEDALKKKKKKKGSKKKKAKSDL